MALMIQLSYQPALDPFHSIFRILRILQSMDSGTALHRDQLRILDFYMLFPFRISGMRLTPQHRRFRSVATRYESRRPYGEQPDDTVMFARMEPMQLTAMEALAEKQLIDREQWQHGIVAQGSVKLPDELGLRVAQANVDEADLTEAIKALATEYSLEGQNGLKHRSGLLEHRYDPI